MPAAQKIKLASTPMWYLARAVLPEPSLAAGVEWIRLVFQNGRHRLIDPKMLGEHDPWRIAQGLVAFDLWCTPGRLLAIVDFDMRTAQAHTEALTRVPILAIARLSSVGVGYQFEDQPCNVQRWTNLDLARLANG